MSIDRTQLLAQVRDFGLDEGEAIVYYELCRLGGARAAEVATAAHRKRPDTYRLLDALVVKGFAEKTLERPTRYMPIELAIALERLLEARRQETEQLQAESTRLAELWPRPHATAGPTQQRFTVYQGRDQVSGLMGRMLAAAEDDITIVASPGGLAHLGLAPFLRSIEGKAADAVRLRLLTKPEGHRREDLDGIVDVAEIRYAELPSYHQMVIIDAKQIALFISSGRKLSTQGEEETVLWLNSPDFVLAQKALFDEVWKSATTHDERLRAQDEGRLPIESHLLRGRWQRMDRLRRMVSRAQGRVRIAASGDEVRRWKKGGLQRALEQRAKRAEVWVWCDEALDIPGATMVRLAEAPTTVDAIVDGREALTVFGAAEAPGDVTYDAEWAMWGTHPDHLATVEQRFARLPAARPIVRTVD